MTQQELELQLVEAELEMRRRRRPMASTGPAGGIPADPAGSIVAPAPDGKTARTQLNPVGKAMMGAGASVGSSIYGLKETLGGLTPNEQRIVQEGKATLAEAGPIAQGAKIAGDIGQFAVPASKVYNAVEKGVKGLTKLPTVAKYLGLSAGGAAASAPSGFIEPTGSEGTWTEVQEEKAGNAGKAAVLGAVLNPVLAKGGQMVSEGIVKPSVETARLLKNSIVPKLQEGAENSWWRFVGRLTSGAVDPKNTREAKEVFNALEGRIAPGMSMPEGTIPERIGVMQTVLNDGYSAVLSGKTYQLGRPERDAILAAGRAGLNKDARAIFEKNIDTVLPDVRTPLRFKYFEGNANRGLSKYRDDFQRVAQNLRASQDADERAAGAAMAAARRAFDTNVRNSKLSQDEIKAIGDLDTRWEMFIPLRESANSAAGTRSIPAAKIVDSSKKGFNVANENYPNSDILGPVVRAEPQGQEARALLVAMARAGGAAKIGGAAGVAASNPAIGAALAPVYAASLLGQTRGGARALYGDLDKQKKLAEFLRNYRPEQFTGAVAGNTE